MVTVMRSLFSQHDLNAQQYLISLQNGIMPVGVVNCGRWNNLIADATHKFEIGVFPQWLNSMIQSGRYPQLAEWFSQNSTPAAPPATNSNNGHIPLVEPSSPAVVDNDLFPALPDSAKLATHLSAGACRWLDAYVEYSKQVSPEGYEDFHEACGIGLLSILAGRRIVIPFAERQYTPLMIILTARTTLYTKTTTARIVKKVLAQADLDWLLGADRTTPQKLLSDMAGTMHSIPDYYSDLTYYEQERIKQRIGMSGQVGWIYNEFGKFIKSIQRQNSPSSDFADMLLVMDDCEETFSYATHKRGLESIFHPYLALIGTMIPEGIKPGSDLWGDGFMARLAPICPPADTALDAPFSEGEILVPRQLSDALKNWHEQLGIPLVSIEPKLDEKTHKATGKFDITRTPLPENICSFAPGVHAAWKRYRSALKEIQRSLPTHDLDGSYGRHAIKAMRIAALLASLENNGVIELRHWAKAQEIAERWRKSLHELYFQANSGSGASEKEDELLFHIRKLEEKGVQPSARDLRCYLKNYDTPTIQQRLRDLARAGVLEEIKSAKTARYKLVRPSEEVQKVKI